MALIDDDSICAICNKALDDKPHIGFTFIEINHPVFEALDDSVVHCECLDNWDNKNEFIEYWNKHSSKGHYLECDANGHVRYLDDRDESEKAFDKEIGLD